MPNHWHLVLYSKNDGDGWVEKIIKKYGLEQTLRGVGRPKK